MYVCNVVVAVVWGVHSSSGLRRLPGTQPSCADGAQCGGSKSVSVCVFKVETTVYFPYLSTEEICYFLLLLYP